MTVVVYGVRDSVPRGVRRRARQDRNRTRIEATDGDFGSAVRRACALEGDVVLLKGDATVERGWLERLQYSAYRADEIGITGPKLLDSSGRLLSAGVHYDAAVSGELGHRYAGREAALGEANIIVPVTGLDEACLYVKREALTRDSTSAVDLSLRGWHEDRRTYYVPSATVRAAAAELPRSLGARGFFGARDVRTSDGRLRVVYVTEDTGVGGGHRDIFEHLNRLAARGHEVELFSLGEHPIWFDLEVPTRIFASYGAMLDILEPFDAIKVAT
ncbi:MAG: hypothetical protein ABI611_22965, partial [Solirubrobacteraceae bacterium]